jgi:hypothetical protein
MFAALIEDAPLLTPRDLADFKKFTSIQFTEERTEQTWHAHKAANPMSRKPSLYCFEYLGGHLPCIKLAIDLGDGDWHTLLDFLEIHFLVKGDFRVRMQIVEKTSSTSDLYPIPIAPCLRAMQATPAVPSCVRGKIVVAILSREMYELFRLGVHRIGDWVVQHAQLFHSPKDYVMEAHLNSNYVQYIFDTDPGCECCQLDIGRLLLEKRLKMERELCDATVGADSLLGRYGVDRIARFFEPPGHYYNFGLLTSRPSTLGSARLNAVYTEVKWHKRRNLLRGLVSCRATPSSHTEETHVLLDTRLLGGVTGKLTLRSFFAGYIVSFL